MLELHHSKLSNNIDSKNQLNKNNLKDSSIIIQDENNNIINDQSNSNINIKNTNTSKTKQKLSISLLHQMQRDPKTSPEEKTKLNELIEEIKTKSYLYGLSDLNGANKEMIISLNQNEQKIKKPELVQLPNSIDYDIEFYKIGKKCSGLKKRYAIIKNGRLFSSDKPLSQIDKKKLKEKTQFLTGAEIINETLDEQSEDRGEWSNKSKKYRIRIDYLENKQKNEYSSFFLYFKEKKELNEVNLALFNICKKDDYKIIAKNTIHYLKDILIKGKRFYTILKILSVKDMFKKRKTSLSKGDSSLIMSAIKFKNNYDNNKNIIKKDDIEIGNSSIKDEKIPNLYAKKNPRQINIEFIPSDYIPLISNISPGNNNPNNTTTLNDIMAKIDSIRNIIPNNILKEEMDESTKNGICFNIQEGIKVKNYCGENSNYRLEQEMCNNINYIFFNKNKPEILFKEENDDNNRINLNILYGNNIYEISNIIKNSNNNLHEVEENNIIILGPKIDNNKGINYKYKNNTSYSDPENLYIKKKNN